MSCSEYLGRYKQRLPTYVDTRPRYRSASQFTDITKRTAAGGNYETVVANTACALVLNAPSTRSASGFLHGGGHNVQDASLFAAYTSGQAQAQATLLVNQKPAQIQLPCYTSTMIPELNDRLATNTSLAAIQASKNQFQRGWNTASCCTVCGKPPTFSGPCRCRLTAAQIYQFKSANTLLHTIEPNANVA
jgi:hypothetical protein